MSGTVSFGSTLSLRLEGNSLSSNSLNSCSDLRGSMQVDNHQNEHSHQGILVQHQQVEDAPPSSRVLNMEESHQLDLWTKALEKEIGGPNEGGEESLWKRVTWTEEMAKLMITALSYISEGTCKTSVFVPKMGKWRAISMVMLERGYKVSPQQCEDKFNELNKKYKRLIVILGKGISCKIVETPGLLNFIDLPRKEKREVLKILSSKHFLYRELCSYHHGNRLFLPHDRQLQRSLMLILNGKYDFKLYWENGDAVGNAETSRGESSLRTSQGNEHESRDVGNEKSDFQLPNHVLMDSGEGDSLVNGWMPSHLLRLEKQKIEIQKQRLELEKERLEWLCYSQREDSELDKKRLEVESMKLANARLAFELKTQEITADHN